MIIDEFDFDDKLLDAALNNFGICREQIVTDRALIKQLDAILIDNVFKNRKVCYNIRLNDKIYSIIRVAARTKDGFQINKRLFFEVIDNEGIE